MRKIWKKCEIPYIDLRIPEFGNPSTNSFNFLFMERSYIEAVQVGLFIATACWGLWDHFVLVNYLFIY